MVFVSVEKDKTQTEKFFKDINLDTDSVFLLAKEGEDAVGCVAFNVKEDTAHIQAVEYDDMFTCELLLRSVANYAERRWIGQMRAYFTEPARVLAALGFKLIDGHMICPVSNVVHMCKNCAEDSE